MASLECDHCGGDAITSEDGLFGEGDGERCVTCDFPGTVRVDDSGSYDEHVADWYCSEADDARCNRADCEDCRELDKEAAMASETTCPRCGRASALNVAEWNRLADEADAANNAGPLSKCGSHLGLYEQPHRVAECNLAHIARLQAENERIKARLVGVLDYSRSLAAASAENADRLERELAEARKLIPPELFPIMGGPAIPWAMIAPHEAQALRNHDQTLRRLAERGGLDAAEAIATLEGLRLRDVRSMPGAEAKARLAALVKAYTDEPLREALRNREREHLEACAEADELRADLAEAKGRVGELEAGARHFAQCHRLCDGCSELARALLATHPAP